MSTTEQVVLRFPSNFFSSDAHDLSPKERDALFTFLQELQKNPFSPDIIAETEQSKGFFAKRVGDLVVYWKPRMDKNDPSKVSSIDILKVARHEYIS
jgi:mRNA-degrading endonuclease RelE of RelBE toxin-antitoxin system